MLRLLSIVATLIVELVRFLVIDLPGVLGRWLILRFGSRSQKLRVLAEIDKIEREETLDVFERKAMKLQRSQILAARSNAEARP